MPGKDWPQIDLLVTIEDIEGYPSLTARKLGAVLDNQLCCNANITSVARSCKIAPYNILGIRPFLTHEAAQILVQALVITFLDYSNSLQVRLLASAIKTLTTHPEGNSVIQDTGTDLQGCQRNCPYLPPNIRQSPHPSSSAQQLRLDNWYHHH